jgi:transcriptional regulator with PAS, ATPase and Fis domain
LLSSVKAAASFNSQEHDISKLDRSGIIGESHTIKSCLASLIPAIESDQSILITGETGVGKELFARAAHENSPRKNEPFVSFNCAAIPEDIMADTMLFGYKKGSHSKADEDTDGLVKVADKGTLFLDEIGDLSLRVQAKLLRCIQEKEVLPMGGLEPEQTDFRLVAATNGNIKEMVDKGTFRQDLYYRINASVIDIPPLRDRREDIRLIADHYILKICSEKEISPVRPYTDEFIDALGIYDWPGNIRELEHEVRGAISRLGKDLILDIHYLSTDIRAFWIARGISQGFDLPYGVWEDLALENRIGLSDGDEFIPKVEADTIILQEGPTVHVRFTPGQTPTLNKCKENFEREYMRQLKGMVTEKKLKTTEVAALAGIDESSYHRLIKKHSL